MANKLVWIPPGVEAKGELNVTYRAYSSVYITKEEAAVKFERRYGIKPEEVFYAPPKGILIYVGPVPGTRTDLYLNKENHQKKE